MSVSTVIKAGEEARLIRRLSTVDLADHLAEARAVIEDARRRAAEIVAEAERKARKITITAAEKGREAGYREGFQAGEEEGRRAAFEQAMDRFEEQHSDVVTAMKKTMDELAAKKRDLMIAAEHDVLELATSIARKLTFNFGELRREAAVQNLKEALRIVGFKTNVTVHANPKDVESLETFATDLAEHARSEQVIRIVSDESVSAGGCRIETPDTEVDATLDTQLNTIVAILTGAAPADA